MFNGFEEVIDIDIFLAWTFPDVSFGGQGASNGRGVVAWWMLETSPIDFEQHHERKGLSIVVEKKMIEILELLKGFLSVFFFSLSNFVAGAGV